jgi:hypothetical protein
VTDECQQRQSGYVAAANSSNADVEAALRLIGTPSISMAEPHRTGKCRRMFRVSTGTYTGLTDN